jgi:hypothetical protein
MYIGMFYITGSRYDYMKLEWLKWLFLVFLILPNGLFILYWVYFMRLEVIKMVYVKKYPRIFKIVSFGQVKYE